MAEVRKLSTAFSLDPSRKAQGGRIEDPGHLRFIRTLPCLVTGRTDRIEAAHIRFGEPLVGKPKTPMGRKPDDSWVVPLCAYMHREGPEAQHRGNERAWWIEQRIDCLQVALALYSVSGNRDLALTIIMRAVRGVPAWAP